MSAIFKCNIKNVIVDHASILIYEFVNVDNTHGKFYLDNVLYWLTDQKNNTFSIVFKGDIKLIIEQIDKDHALYLDIMNRIELVKSKLLNWEEVIRC